MSTPLVQPRPPNPPSDKASLTTSLPGDLLEDTVHRLRVACIVWMVLWAVAVLVNHLILPSDSALVMIGRHLTSEPIPPSIRSSRPIPPQLDDAILTCLAKDPAGRPASAIELSRRLAEVEVPDWSTADARAWWDANLGSTRPAPSADFPSSWPTRVELRVGPVESS